MNSKMFSILFVLFSAFFCVITAQIGTTPHPICGSRYFYAQTFSTSYLTSPNYPSNYPSPTTCEWTITAPFGYVVELSFVDFDTRSSLSLDQCLSSSTDHLEIYDGSYILSSKLRGKYCGNYLPANVYSSSTSLYLRFKSNYYLWTKKGFKIKYTAVKPKPDSSICSPFNTNFRNDNIQLYWSSGYIKSPLYGTKYPSNMQCTWVITVPEGKKIKLTFSNFTVGAYSCNAFSASYDYLQIRDGRYSYSTSLKKLCGYTLPSPIYSSGKYMWIRFKSNSNNYYIRPITGFKAKYESQSAGEYWSTRTTIPSTDSPSSTYSGGTSLVVGIIIAVGVVIFLVSICVCIAKRRRTPGHVAVRAPAVTQTVTVQGTQSTAYQYPQQMQGGFVPPQPAGHSPAPQSIRTFPTSVYPPPSQGSYQYPPPGSYPMSSTGGGTSVPMMPYPQQPIPSEPPPAYPGPPAYPPRAATGQPTPSNPNPTYPPPQGVGTHQSSPPYPSQPATGQAAAINPNPPYPPPQGVETQQSSPPYPPAQDMKQATAPPPF